MGSKRYRNQMTDRLLAAYRVACQCHVSGRRIDQLHRLLRARGLTGVEITRALRAQNMRADDVA